MSQDNVNVVRVSIDAYKAEDFDALMAIYALDAVLVPVSDFPRSAPIIGREALRDWVEREARDWRGRYKASEIVTVGEDRVVSRGEWGGIGIATGIEGYQSMSVRFALHDGLISRAEFFRDHAEALKAVGQEM